MKTYYSKGKIRPLVVIAILLIIIPELIAQESAVRRNTFNINKIGAKFSNYGSISEGQYDYGVGYHPAFEWPIGSGQEYGTAVGFNLGGTSVDPGGVNPDGQWYYATTVQEYKDNWQSYHWAPYGPGPYENEVPTSGIYDFVGQASVAPLSTDPSSWPDPSNADGRYGWPATYPDTGEPVVLDEKGWPGWGPNGKTIGHQESFAVAYVKKKGSESRWLKARIVFRGAAFSGKLYENYIFWRYEITNIGNERITDTYASMRMDFAHVHNQGNTSPEIQAYDADRQMAYSYNPTGIWTTQAGLPVDPTGYAGLMFLKTPRNDDGEELGVSTVSWQLADGDEPHYEHECYLYDLANLDSPYDTDEDGIDDTQIVDGVEYPYGQTPEGWGLYATSVISSGTFTLDPGETDTLTVCTVMGLNLLDLRRNADRAAALFNSGFKVAEPPVQPKVTMIPGDNVITLTWGQESESSEGFEGYRIYRSKDNGASWGDFVVSDATGVPQSFVPYAQYDLKDEITGQSSHPDGSWLWLGNDTGMPETNDDGQYVFRDVDVYNGINYRYYIAAYNVGNTEIPPTENSPVTDPSVAGDNTVEGKAQSPVATATLDDIKVVPNPYVAANVFETDPYQREIHFTHLPAECIIKIFNIAGELIVTIRHDDGTSEATWNLRTSANQEVSPGLYVYNVTSNVVAGAKIDKFLIIK
ncbi:MAG: hypothetical protein WAR79_08135 [Melioribacteraceae bacterium]